MSRDRTPLALQTRTQQIGTLERTIEQLAGAPGVDFHECAQLFHTRVLDKGEYFVRAGNKSDQVAFVASGLARLFYAREDGRECNNGFVVARDFMAALDSLITNEPSAQNIQALTPMQLFVAPYAELTRFFERSVYWQRVQRRILEKVYVKKVRREASLLLENAEQRYQAFLDEYPAVADVVPDYHLAAYLDITAEALSCLKRTPSKE